MTDLSNISMRELAVRTAVIYPGLNIRNDNDTLYSFTSHTFTNCNVTGRFGPPYTFCKSFYTSSAGGSASWANNTSYFNVIQQGYQEWTVPQTALYKIRAIGGDAVARYPGQAEGYGAIIEGVFILMKGEIIYILCGQMPLPQNTSNGGGAGGTFVVRKGNGYASATATDCLVVAGGGGGAHNYARNSSHVGGSNANIFANGFDGYNGKGPGGTGGNGGGNNCYGGSGGGLLTNGAHGGYQTIRGGGSFRNGGAGGYSGSNYGGFGGGAGHGNSHGGGGGGYSGGGGSWDYPYIGGGGGSINNGMNQINLQHENPETEFYDTLPTGGNQGTVLITKL